ncbi:hypothetical protein B0H16DRAFT_1729073 [Mycena metata]|uniref:Uncharacterized protein n=1 Tax=Mycena metata TaxID=1033252 RepID=A0AAD7IEB7_9AGAR|nr:hypothetical protein B0H16DRAFT_1729073 [Mycena metata]
MPKRFREHLQPASRRPTPAHCSQLPYAALHLPHPAFSPTWRAAGERRTWAPGCEREARDVTICVRVAPPWIINAAIGAQAPGRSTAAALRVRQICVCGVGWGTRIYGVATCRHGSKFSATTHAGTRTPATILPPSAARTKGQSGRRPCITKPAMERVNIMVTTPLRACPPLEPTWLARAELVRLYDGLRRLFQASPARSSAEGTHPPTSCALKF